MICQLCLANAATCHVTERSPSGRFGEAHYCPECCAVKYFKPPPHASEFPKPKLTLQNVMILVAVLAAPNAIAAWAIGSGYLTPAQVRRWTHVDSLRVNL